MRTKTRIPAEFVRYVLAGVVNTGLSYALYLLLLAWFPYHAAYAIAYIVGIGTQFLLHTCFVYFVPPTVARLSGYPLIHLLLYGFGALLLHILVEVFRFDASVAALIVIIASIPIGFVLTRFWLTYAIVNKQIEKKNLSNMTIHSKVKATVICLRTLRKITHILRREGMLGFWRRFATAVKFTSSNYSKWIRRYDTITDDTRAKMRLIADDFAFKPLISIIIPCYNPELERLKSAVESVQHQIYPYWELHIFDNASTHSDIRPILEHYSRRDSRIKVIFHDLSLKNSACLNSALPVLEGDYVAFLNQEDMLADHALFWVAEAINKHTDIELIYSDEDKLDEYGKRVEPYFKCDWNYDLFLSQNMIGHLAVYKIGLLRMIGGFREDFEGFLDYDLTLRCIEKLNERQIIHVPRVLYHKRIQKTNTTRDLHSISEAYESMERALNEHFTRNGINARASSLPGNGFYRVHYDLSKTAPLVTLVIPTRNSLHLIRQCISSIRDKTDYPNYEILIIDNGSDDLQTLAYFDSIRYNQHIRILRDDRPFNYSVLNNHAVQVAQGELVGLINDDIEVINHEWLAEMVSIALQPGVGAVGARLWYPNNTLQHGGVILSLDGVANHSHKHLTKGNPGYFGRAILQQSFSAVTAACLVLRRSIFLEAGGFDEENLKIAYNDIDFCLRLREMGYRNVWTPYAEAYHHESATRGYEDTPEKQARFAREIEYMQKRWGSLLLNDPAYSLNLTLEREDFSYAWPPRVAKLEDIKRF
jgi:glycosyltransferase involved in cell wall biosynthesis/putative flippase GtrA